MVADRLNKLRTDIEDTYQAINNLGGTIPSDKNTNNIPEAIRSVYSNLPKVSDTGTNVSLSPTLKGRLGIVPKGNTYQESTTGKNLFNKYGEFNYGNGNISTRLNSNEQIVSTSNFYVSRSKGQLISGLVANTNYCLSGTIISASGTNSNNVVIQILNTSNQQLKVQTYSSSVTKPYNFQFSFDTGENTSIWISFNGFNNSAEGTTETIFDNIQLEKGSTATSYEPYTGGQISPNPDYPQEIQSATGTQKVVVSGKNLFDKDNVSQGRLYSDGTLGVMSGYFTSQFIKVEPSTSYTKNSPTADAFHRFAFYSSNTEASFISESINNTITTPSNCQYLRFCGIDTETNVMLNEGSTATPYQPYQEPQEVDIELGNIELNKIGNYEDYIDGTPDNWVLYKILNKTVLKSNMNWQDRPNYSYADRFVCDNVFPTQKRNMLSNYFKVNYATDDTFPYLTDNGTQCTINFSAKGTTTLTEFKNFLDTHNVEVLYPLAETQQTPITEEPLVSQLNELYYLQSYNDTTNIDVTGNLPMRITASAIKGA